MSNRPCDDNYIRVVREGDGFSRAREFVRVRRQDEEDGVWREEWWQGHASDDITQYGVRVIGVGEGREYIEVIEVVETQALGNVVLYRWWRIDPDDEEWFTPWKPQRYRQVQIRRESTLRRILNGGGYCRDRRTATKPKLRIVASQARAD